MFGNKRQIVTGDPNEDTQIAVRESGDGPPLRRKRLQRNSCWFVSSWVQIGQRAKGWPDYEVNAINTARVAGKTEDEIRDLVKSLYAKRSDVTQL